ncbi:MAG TPA: hypothetical protein VN039_03850 [Nitrospira sp.]|nr:hypothetical protein [Nitrospira sp.]
MDITPVWQYGETPVPQEILDTRCLVDPSMEDHIIALEQCECGAMRVIWRQDYAQYGDPWKNHVNDCPNPTG